MSFCHLREIHLSDKECVKLSSLLETSKTKSGVEANSAEIEQVICGDIDADGVEETIAFNNDGEIIIYKFVDTGENRYICQFESHSDVLISGIQIGPVPSSIDKKGLYVLYLDGTLRIYQCPDLNYPLLQTNINEYIRL